VTLVTLLFILKIVHNLAAAFWIGSVVFNHFLVRPALRLIPAAHAVVIAQRVGTLFLYTGWTALGLLLLTGLLRLYYDGRLFLLFSLSLYTQPPGRSLLLMILCWLVIVTNVAIISFVLRPRLISKLLVTSNPRLADVEKRRAAQIAASLWLDRLNLINVIVSILALIGGVSVIYGGLL